MLSSPSFFLTLPPSLLLFFLLIIPSSYPPSNNPLFLTSLSLTLPPSYSLTLPPSRPRYFIFFSSSSSLPVFYFTTTLPLFNPHHNISQVISEIHFTSSTPLHYYHLNYSYFCSTVWPLLRPSRSYKSYLILSYLIIAGTLEVHGSCISR